MFASSIAIINELRKPENKKKSECPLCHSNTMIPYFGISNPTRRFITLCCIKYIKFIDVNINVNGIETETKLVIELKE